MRKIIYLISLILGVCMAYSQNNVSGVYVYNHSFQIHLNDDMFYFVIPEQDHYRFYYSDTVAICSYKWVNDELIELNSADPRIMGSRSMHVTQSYDPEIDSGIKVIFKIPYDRGALDIEIRNNYNKRVNMTYSEKNNEILWPDSSDYIGLTISEAGKLTSHLNDKYHGLLYFVTPDIKIEESANLITIEIPEINNTFFERYFIIGEYAHIKNDSLVWRGETYIKRKEKIRT